MRRAPNTRRPWISSSPRISAPGQALRIGIGTIQKTDEGVPGFLPLGRHCETTMYTRPRISAPGQALRPHWRPWPRQSQDFCPWAGIATPSATRRSPHMTSQDFCPWAGIATPRDIVGCLSTAKSQDFCPWAGIAICIELAGSKSASSRPRISAPGQALRYAEARRHHLAVASPRISAPGQALR